MTLLNGCPWSQDEHPVTEYMPSITGWQTQSMICIADALALPDAFSHRMDPVTEGLFLADAQTIRWANWLPVSEDTNVFHFFLPGADRRPWMSPARSVAAGELIWRTASSCERFLRILEQNSQTLLRNFLRFTYFVAISYRQLCPQLTAGSFFWPLTKSALGYWYLLTVKIWPVNQEHML